MGSSCSIHQRHQNYNEQSLHADARQRPNNSRQRHHTRRARPQTRSAVMNTGRSRINSMRELGRLLGCGESSMLQEKGLDITNISNGVLTRNGGCTGSSQKHSVVSPISDDKIESFYPTNKNYVQVSQNRRTPKSLAALACDAVCRSLVDLNGELPAGLPQDVVDDILTSLLEHSAITSTTLRSLKNCQLRSLQLTNSRGVTDEWLLPLVTRSSSFKNSQWEISSLTGTNTSYTKIPTITTLQVLSPVRSNNGVKKSVMYRGEYMTDEIPSMDQDGVVQTKNLINDDDKVKSSDLFHGTESQALNEVINHNHIRQHDDDSKSMHSVCSTESFVSATSNHDQEYSEASFFSTLPSTNEDKITSERVTNRDYQNDLFMKSCCTTSKFLDAMEDNVNVSFDTTGNQNKSTKLLSMWEADKTKIDEYRRPSLDDTEISCTYSSSSLSSNDQQNRDLEKKFSSHKLTPPPTSKICTEHVMIFPESSREIVSPSSCCDSYNNVSYMALEFDPLIKSMSPVLQVSPPILSFTTSSTASIELLDLRGCQNITDDGLLQLMNSDFSSLKVARFDNCHRISGRGLSFLVKCAQLHTLSFLNCRRLTDDGIISICCRTSPTYSSMKALVLDGCRCVTDRTLAAISVMMNLTKLDLSQCDMISDKGIEFLRPLNKLKILNLSWCRDISDKGIDYFTSHPKRCASVTALSLNRCTKITDVGIGYLSRLANLQELQVNGCTSINSSALGAILGKLIFLTTLDVSYCSGILRSNWHGKIQSLRTLDLCYAGVKDVQLTQFMNLPNLQELNLDSCPVGDVAITHLADNDVVPNLLSLDLADTNLTDIGMSKIPKFTKLKRLSLFYCNITHHSLRHIAQLFDLEELNLDSRDISDEGLFHLCGLTKLRILDISSGRVTDFGCNHLAKILSLETLNLCGGGIGDLGCSLLANLENLTYLNLSQNERITTRGAAALATLTNLKSLNLSHTSVQVSCLRLFSGLTSLQSLSVYGCKGIDDDKQKSLQNLQNILPKLRCVHSDTSSKLDGMILDCLYDDDDFSDTDIDDNSIIDDIKLPKHYPGSFETDLNDWQLPPLMSSQMGAHDNNIDNHFVNQD